MGRTLKNLSEKQLLPTTIFDRRFVTELCENVHVHYRNLRINLSLQDWIQVAEGCAQALERWKKRGCPETGKDVHIELCRKRVATEVHNDGIKINLNQNLYPHHEGRVFSEGANFGDRQYIHIKIRDLRLEMPVEEFKVLVDAVKEAERKLEDSHSSSSVQEAGVSRKV